MGKYSYSKADNGPLTFWETVQMLETLVEAKLLSIDPNEPNNILIYRNAGEDNPEGWYSENIFSAASKLQQDIKSQEFLRNELKKAGVVLVFNPLPFASPLENIENRKEEKIMDKNVLEDMTFKPDIDFSYNFQSNEPTVTASADLELYFTKEQLSILLSRTNFDNKHDKALVVEGFMKWSNPANGKDINDSFLHQVFHVAVTIKETEKNNILIPDNMDIVYYPINDDPAYMGKIKLTEEEGRLILDKANDYSERVHGNPLVYGLNIWLDKGTSARQNGEIKKNTAHKLGAVERD